MRFFIKFSSTQSLHRSTSFGDRLIRVSIEIRIDDQTMDRDNGLQLSLVWLPVAKGGRPLDGPAP